MLLGRSKKTIFVHLFVSIVFLLGSLYLYTRTNGSLSSTNLIIEAKLPTDDVYQIFYDTGNGYNENDSTKLQVHKNDSFQSLQFSISKSVKSLRFDFGSAIDTLYIKKIIWKNGFREYAWSAEMIVENHQNLNHIEQFELENGIVKITTNGGDPYFSIPNVEEIDKYLTNEILGTVVSYILLLLLSIIIFWSLQLLNYRFHFTSTLSLKTFGSIVLCFSFMLILVLPNLINTLGVGSDSTNSEKRDKAEKPELNVKEESLKEYIQKYEAYINDNFGFREKLIAWNNTIKMKYLKASPVDRVLIGKEDWLFYNEGGVVEDYRGIKQFNDAELERIKRNLEERKRWLEAQGIKFYVMVAPNKHTIYPEYLPSYITKYRESSRLDQLIGYLKNNSEVEIIDVRETLIRNKGNVNLYKKTDTHWNSLGAFYAYNKIMDVIRKDYPNITPLSLDGYSVQFLNRGGDLAVMLSMKDTLLEKDPILVPKFNSLVKDIEVDKSLYPNPGSLVVKGNESAANPYKLVMFRDSFSTDLVPLLSENFNKSVYIWDHNFNTDVIKREKPDIVVHEIVERFLPALLNENPKEMSRVN